MAIDERIDLEPVKQASTADLVNRATQQVSTLVRDELALAKVELMAKGKRAGVGGGLFGSAGVLGIYAFGLLLALAVVSLDLVWPTWLAILVVLAIVLVIAGVAVLVGRGQLERAKPPVPAEAAAGLAADVQAVKDAIREGRHK